GGYNSLYGPIPPLTGLTHLRTFIANNTYFSGSIPSLSGLANLSDFEVYNCNELGGPIPDLNGLISLVRFDVHNDQLVGSIPVLSGLANLEFFDADSNHLSGLLPTLGGLDALESFDATGNLLHGGVPDLVDLPKLQNFGGGTLLDGSLGKLSGLPSLIDFGVDDGLLAGSIPSLAGAPNLQEFYVPGNRLTGNLPTVSGLKNLAAFGVSFNQLTGAVPQPPQSLLDARANSTGGAILCPNLLTPAGNPPTQIDTDWNVATGVTPWSQKCAPDPTWPSFIDVYSSLNQASAGESVTFTALVGGMNPTGTVTFTTRPDAPNNTQATTLCVDVPLQGQLASCTVDNFAGGTSNVIIASYSGDASNAPADNIIGRIFGNVLISSIDEIVTHSVTENVTANPAQAGQPVDLTASVAGGKAGDAVTFYDGRVAICSGVPIVVEPDRQLARCATQFSAAGPHSLTVQYDNTIDGPSDPLIVNVSATAPFDADQFALTGSWYDPPTSGQGMELEVFPDYAGAGVGLLYGGWFMYDTSGHPQWLTMAGDATSAHGSSYSLSVFVNTGGNFNASPVTQSAADGTATMTFYDCTDAALTYNLADGRSGTIPYVRVTAPSGCSDEVPAVTPSPPPANYGDAEHSGAWYNPPTSGQGLMIDFVPTQTTFYAIWYSYAPQSEGISGLAGQRWFELFDPTYTPGNLNLGNVQILATSGGIFDAPSAVTETQVGTAQIDFTSCTSMTLKYAFTQGEFAGLSGTIKEQAIVPVAGCQ
ncbi:MAG: Ig-like domain repeat protein, partial [Proteobacteria bacterium]|nr:Ig-like domain repeat protein [Pseudomonadota bacterium]